MYRPEIKIKNLSNDTLFFEGLDSLAFDCDTKEVF